MGIEIEKKFLPSGNGWRENASGTEYRQGYMPTEKGCTVRVRIAGSLGFLTIKGLSIGAARQEFEYQIPLADAGEMLDTLCLKPIIEKIRFKVEYQGFIWEIDEFGGDNQGLIVAEIELEKEDQSFEKPPWIGEEVTHDPRYFNARLAQNPYSNWKNQ